MAEWKPLLNAITSRPVAPEILSASGVNLSIPSARPGNISLVIPTYNRGDLIAETIDSALRQELPFAEIIVVDDGSTDDTPAVLARFGDRIKVLRLPNGGVQRARNTGVAMASSPWIMLCDSDDLLLPQLNARLAHWLEADPACDAIYCNFVTFAGATEHPDKLSQAPAGFFDGARRSGDVWHDIPDLYARTVTFQPLFVSGNVVRKSLYEAIGGFSTGFNGVGGEDWEFTLRLIAHGRVALCAAPLVRIRRHAGNDSADSMRQERGCIRILEHVLQHHPVAAQYREHILRGIDKRRADVFAAAFAQGDFRLAAQDLAQLRTSPRDLRFRLKALITRLPAALRTPLWRATQAG